VNKQEEALARLAPLVNRGEWDTFLVYITNKRNEVFEALALCGVDALKPLQRELSIYNDLLQLRDTVHTILMNKDSKTQYREPNP